MLTRWLMGFDRRAHAFGNGDQIRQASNKFRQGFALDPRGKEVRI